MIDLDCFKQVNDTYGHLAGDSVLREAAVRMRSVVREYDIVGRYGGEEFLVVLAGCDAANTRGQAERVRQAVASAPFPCAAGAIPVTASIGAAWTGEVGPTAPARLLREADDALYAAKRSGRNRLEIAILESEFSLAG